MATAHRKQYDVAGLAGCVALRRSRLTGHIVAIYVAGQAGLDSAGGEWVCVCQHHHTVCNRRTLAQAHDTLAGVEWCEACQDELATRQREKGR